MGGTSVKVVPTLKYLGISLHHKLSWLPHVKNICNKTNLLFNKMTKVAKTKWGLSPQIMSVIYDSVFLPMISYAAPVWVEGQNQVHIHRKLQSAQRRALLRICRAYSTTSTAALQVIAGKLPIAQELEMVSQRWKMRHGLDVLINNENYNNIEQTLHCKYSEAPENWPFIASHPWADQTLAIFSDGLKDGEQVGSAFVVYQDNNEVHHSSYKLGRFCSVFQAELWGILSAVRWCNDNFVGIKINLFTYSNSSAQSICNYNWRHPIVNQILKEISKNVNSFAIVWVRGHIGVCGNERADELARCASNMNCNPSYTAIPQSFIISRLKESALIKWQQIWDTQNKITRNFFPKVSTTAGHLIQHNVTQFYTAHGRFQNYLYRFNKSSNQNCFLFDVPDGVEHYLFWCPMLEDMRHHIITMLPAHTNWPCNLNVLINDNNINQAFSNLVNMYFKRTMVR
ncbi:uncharacterized protein [Centruroides vittatus]|uniref:uncharacterized protein n=1 Tax=Centruroides vittatus TaxID=120091 RepID=UPI003510C2D3